MIDFPNSPTDGQVFSAANGVVYKYSAAYTSWLAQNPAPPIGGTGQVTATGGTVALAASGDQQLAFGTVLSGNAGLWWGTSTNRYTPPAGSYFLSCFLTGNAPSGSNGSLTLKLRKNGVQITVGVQGSGNASFAIPLAAGEYVDANGSDFFDWVVNPNIAGMSSNNPVFSAFPLTGMQGPTGPPGAGKLLQTVNIETGAVATGSTQIPAVDTIPTNTQGDQYMSLAITPQSATSKLIIEVVVNCSNSAAAVAMAVALFQDATVNALAVVSQHIVTGAYFTTMSLKHVMTSGTTSSTVFKVRIGGNGGTVTFNGGSGARFYGGALVSSITIQEVLP